MRSTHDIGDVGLGAVIAEASKRGYGVLLPLSSHLRYDLVLERNEKLERIQVKTVKSDGKVVRVKTTSIGRKNGKLIQKKYTASEIDAIIVFDFTTEVCYYIPSDFFKEGRRSMHLRLVDSRNVNKGKGYKAEDFTNW